MWAALFCMLFLWSVCGRAREENVAGNKASSPFVRGCWDLLCSYDSQRVLAIGAGAT